MEKDTNPNDTIKGRESLLGKRVPSPGGKNRRKEFGGKK